MADANIFQGAIFHDNTIESTEMDCQMGNGETGSRHPENNPKQTKFTPKPAVHRVLGSLPDILFLKLIWDTRDVQGCPVFFCPSKHLFFAHYVVN